MADLSTLFTGIRFPNPFLLASAPPTESESNIMRAYEAGWGGVVTKTIGLHQVVNVRGPRTTFLRMDDALVGSIDIAIKKAWTAIAFKRPTEMVRQIMMPDAVGFGLQNTDSRICMVSGGLPIVEAGEFLGGIGVSGGLIEEDVAVCVEALKACGFTCEFADPLKAKSR